MIAPGTKSGPVWRIAPGGTVLCYLNKVDGDRVNVSNRVGGGWAQRGTWVPAANVFIERSDARTEYRARKRDTTHAQTADE